MVAVDRSVHNPARIWKLYGTWAGKGDSIPERPHRMAKLIETPASMMPVTQEQLEELAAQAPMKAAAPTPIRRVNGYGQFDLDAFLSRNALDASKFFRIPPGRVVEFGLQVEI